MTLHKTVNTIILPAYENMLGSLCPKTSEIVADNGFFGKDYEQIINRRLRDQKNKIRLILIKIKANRLWIKNIGGYFYK